MNRCLLLGEIKCTIHEITFSYLRTPQQTFIGTARIFFSPSSTGKRVRFVAKISSDWRQQIFTLFSFFPFFCLQAKGKSEQKKSRRWKSCWMEIVFSCVHSALLMMIHTKHRFLMLSMEWQCAKKNFPPSLRSTGVNNWAIRFLISVEFVCVLVSSGSRSRRFMDGRKLSMSAKFVELYWIKSRQLFLLLSVDSRCQLSTCSCHSLLTASFD